MNIAEAYAAALGDPLLEQIRRQAALQFTSGPIADPVEWAKQRLGAHLWSLQAQVARSVKENRYTAVPSCHDGGKSFGAAVLACWWIDTHPVGEAFVVSTAPSATQVSAILWREIERLHRRGKLAGSINMGNVPEWKFGKELVAYGRKPADYNVDTGFQGIHARYPLIIADEAAGIPQALWDAIDALATNEDARVLAIGNPDDASSPFRKICDPGSGWNVIRIDGLRTPNFTEEEVKRVSAKPECGNLYRFMVENRIPFSTEPIPDDLRPRLLSAQWVGERMKRWGVTPTDSACNDDGGEGSRRAGDARDGGDTPPGFPWLGPGGVSSSWKTSALWEAKVRGVFPDTDNDGVIPLGWVDAAVARWNDLKASGLDFDTIPGQRIYSVDVARFGDDETCILTRQGSVVLSLDRIGKQDTMTTANRVLSLLAHPKSVSVVDVIGVGAGVVDRLNEQQQAVVAFNASAGSGDRDVTGEFSFPNQRSAAWWRLRELLDPSRPGGSTLALPPDENLIADLIAPKWKVAPGAKIVVEPKDAIRKRIGRSPDSGDACVMAFSRVVGVDALNGGAATVDWGGSGQDRRPSPVTAQAGWAVGGQRQERALPTIDEFDDDLVVEWGAA